jgi:YfiH family protein
MTTFAIHESGRFPLGRFAGLAAVPRVRHGVTTRDGPAFGAEAVAPACAEAAATAADQLGLAGVAYVRQVHGGTVLRVRTPGLAGEADGLITDVPGLAVLGRSADCPLILVAGRRPEGSPAVGFAHASWRATVRGITATLIARLTGELQVVPATIHAAIAPSAGPCCYEVGPEVRQQALAALGEDAAAFFIPAADRWHLDLWAANHAQLTAGGVPAEQIEQSRICTICQGERFWSWRAQGERAGRFAGLIGVVSRRDPG